ncbi:MULTISPECIES: nuclear transport factor 2 family protein [Lactococcus]|uniref:nuclear transport factor 2 family protein n=1 Tax=Lactococcus TaxID=1357 RepID=UPI001CDBFE84|nr:MULTISPECIES: nuclear transport factor 2 family protein [Lactococcus]MCA2391055.1 nuclear transport factor 2 family protein [Lactococcus sp. NH2-7C]MCT1194993.1 nuclear transport factor 2 family protein [Lactococcus lactis]WGV31398.1 nuclear transport factor 2 family protein [Lactococcus sp. NH2-7C]
MQKIELFQQTIDAWLNKDLQKLLTALSDDIIYTECYGAQYQGKMEIEKWFRQWNNPVENKVKSWFVNKSYVDNETGFFTWTFHYVYKGEENIFDGISLVKFSGNKICEIQEFEQKHEKFRPFLK